MFGFLFLIFSITLSGELMKKLFSIGTVIRVGKGEDLLMIVTRFPLTVKNNIK